MKQFLYILYLFIFFGCSSLMVKDGEKPKFNSSEYNVIIPTAGNSWVFNDVHKSKSVISKRGISNWGDPDDIIRTYFYVDMPGTFPVAINVKVNMGSSKIKATLSKKVKRLDLYSTEYQLLSLGDLEVKKPGYYYIDLQGIQKTGDTYASISGFQLNIGDNSESIKYVKDDFYFGRRGPSTHLVFDNPKGVDDIEWFYSEIEIDKGQDVIGSYFMANGFNGGYFGIQVNSETERRILFSIWSPYKTDNPKSIPEEYRINLLKKGSGVTTGKFGNEGSGGQSYKVFNWKAGVRYGFLVQGKPQGDNSTNYSAHFFDPESETWNLIARFNRPFTDSYLTGLYSFLENFIPETGVLSRRGGYFNQWVKDSKGQWHEITKTKFSADATARKDARLDYSGGNNNKGFYLQSCGFTNDQMEIGTLIQRSKSESPPNVNLNSFD